MAKVTISMPDPMSAYVEARVKGGQYGNVSEYFRDLVRKDQAYHDKKEALVRALIEGEESGVSTRSVDEILADAYRQSLAVAASPQADDDQTFINAISDTDRA